MSEIWFGTKQHSEWVTAPSIDVGASKVGYVGQASFMNGGAWSRRSKAAAKTFAMSWNLRSRAQIQPILDYADGLYGNDYLYYCNPFAMARNTCPTYWASPFVNYYDGPAIVDGIRPDIVNHGMSINGYPVESALYAITSSSSAPYIFLPVPPGYTIHLGAHGVLQSGSAFVTARPELSATASGSITNMTLLSTATNTRVNLSYSGSDYIGVTLSLGSASTGSLQLDGIIAQVLPTGVVPAEGGFIAGIGQSGMRFADQPSVTEYSAALDRVGVTADLVEEEAWAWA